MSLKTVANGFTAPCGPGQQECCVRICWVNDCVADWDLWVRQRDEPGNPVPADKWVSYLNTGPVGQTDLELSSDMDKSSPDGGSVCDSPVNTCGIVAGANGFAGELVCWCTDLSMTFPMTFDIVVNLFGADEFACPDPLADVCVEYFCDGALTYSNVISGVFDFEGLGTAGNFGAGNYPQESLLLDGTTCCGDTDGTSICWIITAQRRDGKLFVDRGPGRAPTKFIIPDDADPGTCMLVEDGAHIPRWQYEVLNESAARKLRVPIASEIEARGMRGRKICGQIAQKRGSCRRCKKGRKKSLL